MGHICCSESVRELSRESGKLYSMARKQYRYISFKSMAENAVLKHRQGSTRQIKLFLKPMVLFRIKNNSVCLIFKPTKYN